MRVGTIKTWRLLLPELPALLLPMLLLAPCCTAQQCFSAADFELADEKLPPTTGYERVVMADYPSTGSSWLKALLNALALARELPQPGCAVYPEGPCGTLQDEGLHCPAASDSSCEPVSTALVKTHFPAQEAFHRTTLRDGQYNGSMRFEKLVVLARHPAATIASNVARWSADITENLACWASWWGRVVQQLPASSVFFLEYEKLCEDTATTLLQVVSFLGMPYANVRKKDITVLLADQPKLRCIHEGEEVPSATSMSNETLDHVWNQHFGQWVTYHQPGSPVVQQRKQRQLQRHFLAPGGGNSLQQLGHNFSSATNPWQQ